MEDILTAVNQKIKNWWLLVILGILLFIAGIWVIRNPVTSYLALSVFFAVTFFVNGIFEILFSVASRKTLQGWGWHLAGGIVDFILGAFLISIPQLAVGTLALLVGFWLLFHSWGLVAVAIDMRTMRANDWGFLLLLGILGAIFATFLLFNPVWGAGTIVIWTSLGLLTAGIFDIYLGFRLRAAHKWLNKNEQ